MPDVCHNAWTDEEYNGNRGPLKATLRLVKSRFTKLAVARVKRVLYR